MEKEVEAKGDDGKGLGLVSITMKDIAREAGVSIATVSMAFKRSPQIPEVTRDRILQLAHRLGYQKSPYISAHMASRRKGRVAASGPVLAFVTPEKTSAAPALQELDIAEAYFEGAVARSAERGYRLERFSLPDPGPSARRLGKILYARNIAGLLVAPLCEGWKRLDLDWSQFSVVALGFTMAEPLMNRVACDAFQAMKTVLDQCHRLGYRRMGLALTAYADARVDRRWLAAYLMTQTVQPALRRLPPLVLPAWNEKRLVAWLKKQRPDVLVTPWSSHLAERLRANGWSIPDKLGLVTLDSPTAEAPVAGIFQTRQMLGSRAVDLLVGAIERNESGVPQFPNTLLIDGVWHRGNSLRGPVGDYCTIKATGFENSRSVSMKEVAQHAGVHVSTVSLSLRNSPSVSGATRARIVRIATELGFRTNPFVSNLMKARRAGRLPAEKPPLAFVTAFPTADGWRTRRIFAQYFEGARDRAAGKGFDLEEVWVPPHTKRGADVDDELRSRLVQGLLLAPLPAAGAHLSLAWKHFCVVGFGFTLNTPRIHRVANDHYSSMARAVRECHRLGYRRIGLTLSATASARVQSRWLASYLVQQRELLDLISVPPLIARHWTKKTVARWLNESKPEVVIASSPLVLLQWLVSLGYSVPNDIGVVGLSCPDLGGSLSGSYERAELLGARAVDVLIGLIERGKYGISDHANTLLVDGIWNPGATVRARGHQSA